MNELKNMTFDELVDFNLAQMTHELFKGVPWRSALWLGMDLAIRWRRSQETNPIEVSAITADKTREAIIKKLMESWKSYAKNSWNNGNTKNMPIWVREALNIPKVK